MKRINAFEFIARASRSMPFGAKGAPLGTDILLEHEGTVLVVRKSSPTEAYVALAVGDGLGWARELVRLLKNEGVRLVGFSTSVYNEPVRAIARYFGAAEKLTRETYSDGSRMIGYKVDLHSRRFRHG